MKEREIIPELDLDWSKVTDEIVTFIRDMFSRTGFSRAVVGLSGGVDSALTAYLTTRALGRENILCVKMPYKTSSASSISDADAVIKMLDVASETVDISRMVDTFADRFPDMDHIRKGNVMARVRMIVLYDISAREKALVMGTGNKTERLLGYTTLYGDSACALNPIGDLYKTQVWAMASYAGLPQHIISKPPSADLWVGQTDEGELGVPYAVVDKVLHYYFDRNKTKEEIVSSGVDPGIVERILTLAEQNRFKREAAPIAKITIPLAIK
ncbi:MAG: NAD+ synthase [Chlorobi bacterium]|nr:NAD+ synthase [Chlorobiota bacterium]